jgi:dihydroorotase
MTGIACRKHELMRRAMEYAKMFDLPVMDHCQDYSLVTDGVAHEGYWSAALGLRGWPASGEELIVARNILLAELTGARVHCQHFSAAGSVSCCATPRRAASAHFRRGLPASFHAHGHGAGRAASRFGAGDGKGHPFRRRGRAPWPRWPSYDTNFKMNPPVRTAADRAAIIDGLADGTLEIIGSDHAPHCDYEKEVEFDYAPFGIIGFETELALSPSCSFTIPAAFRFRT